MTDTNTYKDFTVEIVCDESGDRESVRLDTLVGAYHAFGVLTNLHHLMIGHHEEMSIISAEDSIAFVWSCPEECDVDKVGTTVTWIPAENRMTDTLAQLIANIPGYIIADVIFGMTDTDNEVVHTATSFRMRGDQFGFMEIR